MWKYFNPNPRQLHTGDCVVRAICAATGESWDEVFTGLCLYGYDLKMMPTENALWMAWLKALGFTRTALPDTCPDCYTVADFAAEHPEGTFVLATGSHVVTVIHGDWYDTWDSGDKVPIYFWRR